MVAEDGQAAGRRQETRIDVMDQEALGFTPTPRPEAADACGCTLERRRQSTALPLPIIRSSQHSMPEEGSRASGPATVAQARRDSDAGRIRSVSRCTGTWCGWLDPWTFLWRCWHAWSSAPPPPELRALLDAVGQGHPLDLYLRS